MDRERYWTAFVDGVTVLWVALFLVSLAADFGPLSLAPGRAAAIDRFLRVAVIVFVADVCVLYWYSGKAPLAFARSQWFLMLSSFPWFRPLRVLRLGRSLRALRVLSRSRRVGSLLGKCRRVLGRFRNR
jgi:hypothetical protein